MSAMSAREKTFACAFLTALTLVFAGAFVAVSRSGAHADRPTSRNPRLEQAIAGAYNTAAARKHIPYRVVKVHCTRQATLWSCRSVVLTPGGPSCAQLLVKSDASSWRILAAVAAPSCPEAERR